MLKKIQTMPEKVSFLFWALSLLRGSHFCHFLVCISSNSLWCICKYIYLYIHIYMVYVFLFFLWVSCILFCGSLMLLLFLKLNWSRLFYTNTIAVPQYFQNFSTFPHLNIIYFIIIYLTSRLMVDIYVVSILLLLPTMSITFNICAHVWVCILVLNGL